jgi:hypothetical protein
MHLMLHQTLFYQLHTVKSVHVFLPSANPLIPASYVGLTEDKTDSSHHEMDWLHRVKENVDGNGQDINLSWAAFHAEPDIQTRRPNCIAALLPLFHLNANTAAMMKHCLKVIQAAIH